MAVNKGAVHPKLKLIHLPTHMLLESWVKLCFTAALQMFLSN